MAEEAETLSAQMAQRFREEQDRLERYQLNLIAEQELVAKSPLSAQNRSLQGVRQSMRGLNKEVQGYYSKNFPAIYEAGAQSIDPTFRATAADRNTVARLAFNQYLPLRGAIEQVPLETRRFIGDVRKNYSGVTRPKYERLFKNNPEATLRNKGIKAIAYKPQDRPGGELGRRGVGKPTDVTYKGKSYTLGDYGQMQIRSAGNRAYNLGAIHAAQKKKIKWLAVSDGPDCGWTYHNDGQLANGMVVTVEEARAYPVAHPNCQRSFSPATEHQEKKEKERRLKATATRTQKLAKAAAITGVAGGALLTGAQFTNLLAAGAERLAKSQYLNDVISRMAKVAFHGDLQAQKMLHRLNQFQDAFGARAREDALILRGIGERAGIQGRLDFPLNVKNKFFDSLWPGNFGDNIRSLPEIWRDIHTFGGAFLHHMIPDEIPGYIKRAVGAAENATVGQLGDRFSKFYYTVTRGAMSDEAGENLARVIDMEARRRGAFQALLFRGTVGARATWSKWGPRMRINIMDLARGALTKTPTGYIRSLSIFPRQAVRSVLKMYQDGTIGGHISVIPKKFMKGILRAIIEVDENGRLVGNIRLVPGGPLRVRLEFAAGVRKTYEDWTLGALGREARRRGLDHIGTRLQLMDRLARSDGLAHLEDFAVHPLGAAGNLYQAFRKFEFRRAVLELRIFNRSVLNISANLRIPVREVRAALDDLVKLGLVTKNPNGTYTGLFRLIKDDPNFLKYIFKDVKSTAFGNIRFSSLSREAVESSPFFRALQRGNVRLLTRAQMSINGLQDIATNMRIHGWNIYRVADVLKIRWDQARKLAIDGMWEIKNYAEDLGIRNVEDLLPAWEAKLKSLTTSFRRSPAFRDVNEIDALKAALQTIEHGANEVRPIQRRNLLKLLGVDPGAPAGEVYNKTRNLMAFLRKTDQGIDSASFRAVLDNIDEIKMRRFSREISAMRRPRLRNVSRIMNDETGAIRFPGIERPLRTGAEKEVIDVGPGVFERIAKERPNSILGKFVTRHGLVDYRHPALLARRGEVEFLDEDIFVTMPDGTVKKILTPYVRLDDAEWEKFIDDLADLDPQFWDDLYNEMNFMGQRYGVIRVPDILIDDITDLSPYYNNDGSIVFPFRGFYSRAEAKLRGFGDEVLVRNGELSQWVGHYQEYWPKLSAIRDAEGEVRGALNPVFIHEYTHYLHDRMMATTDGRNALLKMFDSIGKYMNEPNGFRTLFEQRILEVPLGTTTQRLLDPLEQEELFRTMVRGDPIVFFGVRGRDAINEEFGDYGSWNLIEFIAEANRHYLTDEVPGPIATIIGQAIDRFFGITGENF